MMQARQRAGAAGATDTTLPLTNATNGNATNDSSSNGLTSPNHNNNTKKSGVGTSFALWRRTLLLQQQAGIPLVVLYFGGFMAVVCLLGALSGFMHLGSYDSPDQVNLPSSSKKLKKGYTTPIVTTTSPVLDQVKEEFYQRYGGHDAAMDMLHRGVQILGSGTATAHRMLRAAATHQPFVIAFAGYSVTVGRGNFFNQSFPFVLERVLQGPLEAILPTSKLVVRNAAIGGIPSFPYAFCFSHFLGEDADVISWDYSMNEGHGAAVLEAYVRQGLSQLPKRPMLIMLDDDESRIQLLRQYTNDLHILPDAMTVNSKNAIDRRFIDEDASQEQGQEQQGQQQLQQQQQQLERPLGYQGWEEFGAPATCPGRNGWHPKKMEHELLGWVIAMHFINVLEEVHTIMQNDKHWKTRFAAEATIEAPLAFPPILSTPPKNDASVTELLYGQEKHPHRKDSEGSKQQQHRLHQQHQRLVVKDVSCRTSFLPAMDQETTLPSVVVSGLAPDSLPIMQPRPDSHYEQGWVLDVSKIERDTKVKVEKCGGLGYVDMKIALYGIPASGPLRLWLPFESQRYNQHHKEHDHTDETDKVAKHWFDDLVFCEANEKRPAKACHLNEDLEYTVGGVRVEQVTVLDGAGVYLKRPTCVHISVPATAQVTRLNDVKTKTGDSDNGDGEPLSSEQRRQLLKKQGKKQRSANEETNPVGLVVDITVKPRVTREAGACCLSHIVWEQH